MQSFLQKTIVLALCSLLTTAFAAPGTLFVQPNITSSSVINNTTGTQFTLRVQVDQAATVYYVVNTVDTNPSAADVRAGNVGGGAPAPISGSFVVTAATNTNQIIPGLTAGTSYYINFIAENGGAEQSGVSELNAIATDITAPTYNTSSTLNITGSQFDYRANVDEDATIFYVVTTSTTTPSVAQILAGNDHTGSAAFKSGNFAATAGNNATTTISGLTTGTQYYVYAVARDDANNNSTIDNETATTTADTTAPTYNSSSTLNIGATTFDYRINVSENATIYYVVTTSATPPTAAQIIAGNDNTGSAALKSGNFAATTGVDATTSITGLTASTAYRIYSIARDPANNNSTVDSETATTTCTPTNATGVSITDTNTSASLTWTNASCFDEVLIVARQGSAVTATPNGNGSAYTANTTFASGTPVSPNQYAVYKGNGTTVTVTGLTDGNAYYFTIFTRKGTSWSSGVTISTAAGNPRVVSFNPTDGSTGVATNTVFTITFNENVIISTSPSPTVPRDRIIFDQSGTDLTVIRDNSGVDGTISITGNVEPLPSPPKWTSIPPTMSLSATECSAMPPSTTTPAPPQVTGTLPQPPQAPPLQHQLSAPVTASMQTSAASSSRKAATTTSREQTTATSPSSSASIRQALSSTQAQPA